MAPVASRAGFQEDYRLFAGFLEAVPETVSSSLEQYDSIVVIGASRFYLSRDWRVPAFPFRHPYLPDHRGRDCSRAGAQYDNGSWHDEAVTYSLAGTTAACSPSGRPPARPTPAVVAATNPLSIELVMQVLSKVIPADAIIVEEAPSHSPAMQKDLPIRRSGGFFTMASGGLEYGLPTAVGTALAQQRRVVCLLGDGSAMYFLQAL